MPEILYLIDGHALAYRTYYALTAGAGPGRWVTSSGEPTAGIYGFVSVLLRILEQENPDYIAVAFDTGKTFRDDIFPDYKGTREKMPDDLRPQIERIREIVDAFNIPRLEMNGYEADDVLGSVAKHAVQEGLGVKIFTGDRDLLQLVEDRIIVNLPGRSLSEAKDYLPQDVVNYLGVRPEQIVDYKALVGDPSDNIPGVKGIGAKTAVRLLSEYQTLDGIYQHLSELKPGERKKLEAGKESAYLSQKLARIVTDLTIPLDLKQARPHAFNPQDVRKLFRELEFRSLLDRLGRLESKYGKTGQKFAEQLDLFGGGTNITDVEQSNNLQNEVSVRIINSADDLNALVEKLSRAEIIAVDTETTSTDQMRAELVGISLAVSEDEGYYIPVGHYQPTEKQLSLQEVRRALEPIFTAPHIKKAGHNLKYDYVVLKRHGLEIKPLAFDTMIAEWLINPASRNLGLKNLAWVRMGYQMKTIDTLIGKGKHQSSMAEIPVSKVAPYAVDDVIAVIRLMPKLKKELEKVHATELFNTLEMPLISVLGDMEIAGIGLDVAFLREMSAELGTRMMVLEQQIYDAVGNPFNLNSTQQLSVALFETLGLEPPDRTRKTSSGHYSTAAGVLENMRGMHPVIDWILEYRELSKLRSTYLDALPEQVNPDTGRVHTSYNQTGSVTGRLASSNPNLQNIPIRSELGKKVRKAFVAAEGHLLLSVDYSQVELRIAAHMSQDEAMIRAFKEDMDIHAATAAAIYHVDIDKVTAEQRRHAKAINFGLLYGMSPFGLTRSTDLTLAEAEDFVETYFKRFPGIKRYLDETRNKVEREGYVETLMGRRRYFPALRGSVNQNVKRRIEREAINAPIQGTAADIIKLAMLKVAQVIEQKGLHVKMLLQVHDELVFEVPSSDLREVVNVITYEMENAYQLDVPLKTDARAGRNWGEMVPIDD